MFNSYVRRGNLSFVFNTVFLGIKVYNTKFSYRNTKKNFSRTNLFITQKFFEFTIIQNYTKRLYKITIFEISFELSKIFKNGFYQKVPRKNLEKLNLKQEKLI
jgi:hypothetical protein